MATCGGAAWNSEMKGAHKGKPVHKRWTGRNIPDAPESPKVRIVLSPDEITNIDL